MIPIAALVAAGIGPTQARTFEAPLAAACARFGIDTPQREAAFLAQIAHESRLLTALEEGLYYRDPARICKIFPSTVPNLGVAQGLACNPKALANHVYANRNGNRDEASGDGWRYRGRGLIQLTGRANYARAAAALDRPYVEQPDLVLEPADACLTAAWFWDAHNLNALADAARFDDVTRAINGPAMAGAQERRHFYAMALTACQAPAARSRGAPPPAPPTGAVVLGAARRRRRHEPESAGATPSRPSGRHTVSARSGVRSGVSVWRSARRHVRQEVHRAARRAAASGPAAQCFKPLRGHACPPEGRAARSRQVGQGLTNFSTNSSFGCAGSGTFRSRGSCGFRKKSPEATHLKPAASTSRRTKASSTQCSGRVAGLGDAGAGPAGVVGDHEDAARLQRPKDRRVHPPRGRRRGGRGRGS